MPADIFKNGYEILRHLWYRYVARAAYRAMTGLVKVYLGLTDSC